MSRKIIGATVGTPTSPATLERLLNPVKTINGVKPDKNGNVVVQGGESGGNNDIFNMTNDSGWLAKSVQLGGTCDITLSWSSIDSGIATGDGILTVAVNGYTKLARAVQQGIVVEDVGKFLSLGINNVAMSISDSYGHHRTLNFVVTAVSISISSYFIDNTAFHGEITFGYTPVGALEKTVHFLVDDTEIGTQVVTESNREQFFIVPQLSHGSHTFEVFFTGSIDGQDVESNHLFYDLICVEEGNNKPIITTTFRNSTAKQYETVNIQYIVYTPNALTSEVQLKDGDTVISTRTVDRTRQSWPYKVTSVGAKTLYIVCGDTIKPISFDTTESDIHVQAESKNLELYLASAGRDNNEDNPLDWSYNGIAAEMTGFNLKSDCWQLDDNGNTVLRVLGDARVYIPFNIFGTDFRATGKTIEVEFATRDVMNYDAVVLSCWSGGRGIKITAQQAMLKSEQSEVFTPYKEDEHVRVTFCVEKQAENRLLYIYTNGIISGVVQYTGGDSGDDFSQLDPVGISIGASECTVDIYCIRVYGNNLTQYQILDNWIADTQDLTTMTERYTRNEIFDDYGNIILSKLPKSLPYFVVNAESYEKLPQTKGDKKTVSGFYVDPLNEERSFTFEGAEIDVQGTSSATYPRKNYKVKFKGGFVVNGDAQDTYQLRSTSMPTDVFTFKADVASSEGANNVELVMFYEDTCPVKTPPQLTDSRVRQGIEGYPCLMFYYDGANYHFIGKYNFNNDKATEEVFGFDAGDESWEIRLNNTDMVIWKNDDFSGTAWEASFEARYPDKSKNITNLQALATWLKSTDTTATGLTDEEKASRLAKFKNEFANWFNTDAMLFNYIFTEMFLLMDNRAKNAFPTRYDEDGKWLILPYDYDSAIGINNMGELRYGYHLEDIDTVGGDPVFNGQDSVLFVNIRLAFADELKAMYQQLRKTELFCYDEIERRFEEHQRVWGEAIFNEDAKFKYIEPLTKNGSSAYLSMLQGSKAEQRKWWLYNRFRYLDSKYEAGDSLTDFIKIRPRAVADITVTPYADIYAAAKFDSIVVNKRALRENGSVTLENPLDAGKEADVLIYSASQLSDIGDLSPLKIEWADFSMAHKLTSLKVGSNADGYENPHLTTLTVGNLSLLKEIDVRNCSALAGAVDLSGCANIESVYLDGTKVTGVNLPNGGIIKTLHLPETLTSLSIQNHKQLSDFSVANNNYSNISTLRLEGVNETAVDFRAILDSMAANSRVRIIGLDMQFNNSLEVLDFYDKLDTFRGLDENGHNTDNAVVSGTIHVNMVTEESLSAMISRYPSINIDYAHVANAVVFVVNGEVISSQFLLAGDTIIKPDDPSGEITTEYIRAFKGWSLDGETVTTVPSTMGDSSLTFTALFTVTEISYRIRFLNVDGTVLAVTYYKYGQTPSYGGTPVNPTFSTVEFIGWEPAITTVTGDADYVAKYEAVPLTHSLVARSLVEYSSDTAAVVGDYAFAECSALVRVNLPSLETILQYAFNYCTALTYVNIPSVTAIKTYAFRRCNKLQEVHLPSTPPTLTNTSVFDNVPTTCVFYIPTGSLSAYQSATNWSSLTSKYTFTEEDRG